AHDHVVDLRIDDSSVASIDVSLVYLMRAVTGSMSGPHGGGPLTAGGRVPIPESSDVDADDRPAQLVTALDELAPSSIAVSVHVRPLAPAVAAAHRFRRRWLTAPHHVEPEILNERGLPLAVHAATFDDHTALLPAYAGLQTWQVDADGGFRPHADWPRPMLLA